MGKDIFKQKRNWTKHIKK